MILYSIIPAEVVFANPESGGGAAYFEAEYLGETILVSKLENGDYVISRLLSTKPRSYLTPELQPGNIIKGGELAIKKS